MIRHLFKLVWNRKRSNLLLIAEIFLSFLIIVVVATSAIAFLNNTRRPLGFSYDNVWTIAITMPQQSDDTWTPAMTANFDTLLREIRHTPGVIGAAGSMTPAYSFGSMNGNWRINNRSVELNFDEVTDDFAKVMGLQLVGGRWFSREDDASSFRPVVVDENAARALYGDENPLGKKFGSAEDGDVRVVGVVRGYRKSGEYSFPLNFAFRRVRVGSAETRPPRNILIRLAPGTGAEFEAPLMKRLDSVVPDYTYKITPLAQSRKTWLRIYVAPVVAATTIGFFLIVMVALGLTGVMWQNVTRRTRELGLRRAVGANRPMVRRQVLGEVAALTTMSIVVGTALALHVPALGLFPRITTGVFATGLLVSVVTIYALTLLCGLYPSWLAARVEPAEALHYD